MTPQASSTVMFSLKIFLMSTAVLSAAIMLKIYFPAISKFAVYELPSVYNSVISWLQPPYLLFLNCIIITIVTSSKLRSTKDDVPTPPQQPLPTMDDVPLPPQPVTEVKITLTDYLISDSSDRDRSSGYDFKEEKGSDCDGSEVVEALLSTKIVQTASSVDAAADGGVDLDEDVWSNKENEYVNIKSSSSTTEIVNNSTDHSFSKSKPPVSARVGHRRNIKSSPEGGGKAAALGVSRPKGNETLDSTWNIITEGRSVPLTRQLRKSDTWESQSRHPPPAAPTKMMTKSETFQERRGGGAEGDKLMKKEAWLSQEELNKRVEAFINKFNQEMRLQRQESLNQYMEMVKRGSH